MKFLLKIDTKKKVIFVIMVLMVSVLLYSDVSGEDGWQFLKMALSPVSSAQAETGAFSNDVDALMGIVNPAAPPRYNSKFITTSYSRWFETDISSVAYLNSNGRKAFGISARYLNYGKLDKYDETGDLIGEFHPMDIVITNNFSYRLNPVHYFGVNLSLLYEQIDTSSSYGFSGDLGYMYITSIKGLKVATALKNLGFTSKMDEERISLPITMEFSLIQDFKLADFPISTELKMIKYFDENRIKINYGVNTSYKDIIKLRLGYKYNDDSKNILTGIGFKLNKFRVDYTYIPGISELGDIHQIGVNYIF